MKTATTLSAAPTTNENEIPTFGNSESARASLELAASLARVALHAISPRHRNGAELLRLASSGPMAQAIDTLGRENLKASIARLEVLVRSFAGLGVLFRAMGDADAEACTPAEREERGDADDAARAMSAIEFFIGEALDELRTVGARLRERETLAQRVSVGPLAGEG